MRFKTQRSFSVPTTKDPKNSSEHQVFDINAINLKSYLHLCMFVKVCVCVVTKLLYSELSIPYEENHRYSQ